ncbi:MAG TPA: hypothetical protein V6D18_19850 [Thermosynechococcaceae cyanobacterium]
MKTQTRWLAIPTALAIALGTASTAFSAPVLISSSSADVQLNGTSGGPQKDGACAGFVSASPNHVVQVTDEANLNFTLRSTGQPALLIRSASGQSFCVPADSLSNGTVVIPGLWTKGTYSVFVGDRANGQHPYTLSISRK